MQLGYIGVALWCALWGYCLGAIYSWFMRSRQGNFQVALYFAFLPIFIIAFRDGGLLTVLRTGVFYITPVLVWMWMARAMGIPDPSDLVRRASRVVSRGRKATPPAGSPSPQRRQASEEIVPRAWRGRNGPQRAQ